MDVDLEHFDDDEFSGIDLELEGNDKYRDEHAESSESEYEYHRHTKRRGRKRRGKHRIQWEEMVEQLAEFKRIDSHCNITQRDPDYPYLSKFVKKIREYKRKMSNGTYTGDVLTPHRIKELTDMGFVWSLGSPKNANHLISIC